MARTIKDNGYAAIRVEGGILPPEFLQTIATTKAPRQTQSDYGLTRSFNIKDEIGRAWRLASDLWDEFKTARVRTDLASDQTCVKRWLQPLLGDVLGFMIWSTFPKRRSWVSGISPFPMKQVRDQSQSC